MASMKEIPVFEGLSIAVSVVGDLATLSVMGATPVMIHLPKAALPHLQRQIAQQLSPPPQPSAKG